MSWVLIYSMNKLGKQETFPPIIPRFQIINSFLKFIYPSINEQPQLLRMVIFAGGTMEYLTVYILGFCNTWIFQYIVLLFKLKKIGMQKIFQEKVNVDNISLLYYSQYNRSSVTRCFPVIPLLQILQELSGTQPQPQPPFPDPGCSLSSIPISPCLLLMTSHPLSDSVGHPSYNSLSPLSARHSDNPFTHVSLSVTYAKAILICLCCTSFHKLSQFFSQIQKNLIPTQTTRS